MLDVLFAFLGQLKRAVYDRRYQANEAIISADYRPVAGAQSITIVFPPWHVPKFITRRICQNIVKSGSSVLYYNFNPLIMYDNPNQVVTSFQYVADTIRQDIANLVKAKGYQEVNLLGISLGNVALCMTAERLDNFNSVTMIVPGAELASPFWNGWRTRKLRGSFIKYGITLHRLQTTWRELAPRAHIKALKGHPTTVILSKKDRFVPYMSGKQLVDILNANGVQPRVEQLAHTGHIGTALRYAFNRLP